MDVLGGPEQLGLFGKTLAHGELQSQPSKPPVTPMPRPSPKQPMTPADLVLERRKLDRQRNLSSEPKVRPEVVEKLVELSRKRRESEPPKASLKERSALVTQRMIESGNRYAGNPELLLKEHPRRNFENPPKQE